MTDTNQIVGPDPAVLTDAELSEAALLIADLGQQIAGTPGEPVPSSLLDELPPARRFTCEALWSLWCVLLAENERRLNVDDAEILDALTALLSGPDLEA